MRNAAFATARPRRAAQTGSMKTIIISLAAIAVVLMATRCLGDSHARAYAQIACADVNNDNRLNDGDATEPARLPDFNGDGLHDDADAAFLRGIDISLDPAARQAACSQQNGDVGPDWSVLEPGTRGLSCDGDDRAVLILGIGGGVTNLRQNDAAGVKKVIGDATSAFEEKGVRTVTVLSGQALISGAAANSAMELWVAHATQVMLDAYPCLRVVMIGHSHGAIVADVAAAKLEAGYADRFVEVVNLDRVEPLYAGDTQTWPSRIRIFNVHESNDPGLSGAARDAQNVENWDATGEKAPENGDKGGALKPVDHTTIDNSESVRKRIVDDVVGHSE